MAAVLLWSIVFLHFQMKLLLLSLRIFGQEQRLAVQEPKRGETEVRWPVGRLLNSFFFPGVDSEVKCALCVPLQVMCMSENKILTQCFDREELSDKKRPDTVRHRDAFVSICVSLLAFRGFPRSSGFFPSLVNPSMLSHSKTNSGVFPLSSVEWAVWRGFSAAAHSLRNALTLVCPPCTLAHSGPVTGWRVKSPRPPHWTQCSASAGLPVTPASPRLTSLFLAHPLCLQASVCSSPLPFLPS